MQPTAAYAFFDVDDTLIRTKSMFSFFRFWCLDILSDPKRLDEFNAHFDKLMKANETRESLNSAYYRFFAGVSALELSDAADAWAAKMLSSPERLFFEEVVQEMNDLAKSGIEPVFVSGSFPDLLQPIARHLGVKHILSTQMNMSPGCCCYNGEISSPQTIGEGKATAISQFLGLHHISAPQCHAFGDDISDLPMLEAVGFPHAVGNNTNLTQIARVKGWPVIEVSGHADQISV